MDGSSASSQVGHGLAQGGLGGPGWERGCPEHWPLFSPPSYEFMRRSLIFYRNEIQKMTGKVGAGHGMWGGGFLGWGSHCHPPNTTGPLGAVWHIRRGSVPAEWPEGVSPVSGSSASLPGLSPDSSLDPPSELVRLRDFRSLRLLGMGEHCA